tara:strand:- start:2279 stop:2458 length:180 start_codon:yes stop_codon:yes gene_type:complete
MKPGDLVRNKNSESGELGLFVGYRRSGDYEFAEVMFFNRRAANGDIVCTIQKSLLEVVK